MDKRAAWVATKITFMCGAGFAACYGVGLLLAKLAERTSLLLAIGVYLSVILTIGWFALYYSNRSQQ